MANINFSITCISNDSTSRSSRRQCSIYRSALVFIITMVVGEDLFCVITLLQWEGWNTLISLMQVAHSDIIGGCKQSVLTISIIMIGKHRHVYSWACKATTNLDTTEHVKSNINRFSSNLLGTLAVNVKYHFQNLVCLTYTKEVKIYSFLRC